MSTIKLGWAMRDVTTDKPVPIPGQGYARISEGVMDPITTTALVMDDGNDCVIFVSLDMVVARCGLLDEIRARLTSLRPDIPAEKILLNTTHAHTGPSHYFDEYFFAVGRRPEDWMPVEVEFSSGNEYRSFLVGAMADMIIEAWDKRAEGGIAYGYGYAVVAHSRRVCYFDDLSKRGNANNTYGINGTAAMYGNTNDDNFSHYEAGADHFVNLLYTFDPEGNLTGAIVNVPCPSQNSESEWMLSADYWHDVRVAIRKKFGDIFILPQCAAAGDLSPRILHYRQAQDRRFRLKYDMEELAKISSKNVELAARKDIAERIADAFEEVLSWARKDIRTEAPIAHNVTTQHLPRTHVTEADYNYCKARYEESLTKPFVKTDDPKEDLVKNSTLIGVRQDCLYVMKLYDRQKTEPTLPMEMHVLKIGDIAFASNRFELYMDFQHRIQARSPFEQTFIVQLAAQPGMEGGYYLCTERAAKARGYSAVIYTNLVSPEGGQMLVNETVRQLKDMYEEK